MSVELPCFFFERNERLWKKKQMQAGILFSQYFQKLFSIGNENIELFGKALLLNRQQNSSLRDIND